MKLGPDRLALFGAVLVLLAGFLFVFRPMEATIGERYAALDDGRLLLDRRLALAKRANQLTSEQHALTSWLAGVGMSDSRTTIVNRFLRAIAATATQDGVHIASVRGIAGPQRILPPPAPGTLQAAGAAAATSATPITTPVQAVTFDEIPLTLSLRGSYQNVLHMVHDLNRTDLAARIGLDSLGNPALVQTRNPELQATLHVTLLRNPDSPKGGTRGPV
jgi:hypothetical protein